MEDKTLDKQIWWLADPWFNTLGGFALWHKVPAMPVTISMSVFG